MIGDRTGEIAQKLRVFDTFSEATRLIPAPMLRDSQSLVTPICQMNFELLSMHCALTLFLGVNPLNEF